MKSLGTKNKEPVMTNMLKTTIISGMTLNFQQAY